MKISIEQAVESLKKYRGNVSAAALALGIDRSSLYNYINNHEEVRQALLDSRESMLDDAESALGRAIRKGESWAVCFALKTIGKSRGFIERQELDVSGKLKTGVNPDDLSDDELARIASGSS